MIEHPQQLRGYDPIYVYDNCLIRFTRACIALQETKLRYSSLKPFVAEEKDFSVSNFQDMEVYHCGFQGGLLLFIVLGRARRLFIVAFQTDNHQYCQPGLTVHWGSLSD